MKLQLAFLDFKVLRENLRGLQVPHCASFRCTAYDAQLQDTFDVPVSVNSPNQFTVHGILDIGLITQGETGPAGRHGRAR